LGKQVNAIDGLEKRVKSRFGGRIIQVSRPSTIDEFWSVCDAALKADDENVPFAEEWNRNIQVVPFRSLLMKKLRYQREIDNLCKGIFVQSRDVREFFYQSIPVVSSLQLPDAYLPFAKSWSNNVLLPPESKLCLIPGWKSRENAKLG
jgi:hypothetical protein